MLLRSRQGNVATSFALTLIPLMTVMGMALDFSRAEGGGTHVQYALDGSVLAAARVLQENGSDKDIQAQAQTYFNSSVSANKSSITCGPVKIVVNRLTYTIDSQVTCSQSTTLSGIVGLSELSFTRKASTAYGVGKLDVVFMFDTSGSMGSQNRMTDLKKAAKDAVKTILSSQTKKEDDVRIAISTYGSAVNVGTEYFKAVTNAEPNTWECTKWKKKKGKYECQKWEQVTSTCVTGREGTQKYTDAAPGSGAWIKYDTTSCNSATLTPLTFNETELNSAIDSLPTSGMTAGHLGIVWSWYLISPEWSSIWPASAKPKAYDEPDLTKVAILMTDGGFNQDYMSNGDSFAHAKTFCDAMKAKGIQVYTVAFKAPSQGEEILAYCASSEGQAFSASSGQELSDAYQRIATSVSDLRISH